MVGSDGHQLDHPGDGGGGVTVGSHSGFRSQISVAVDFQRAGYYVRDPGPNAGLGRGGILARRDAGRFGRGDRVDRPGARVLSGSAHPGGK
ncbi:hypothetical protein quinque_007047 [Culex quinquefasciatus]